VIPTDSIVHVGAQPGAAAHDSFPSSAARVAPTGGTRVLIGNLELRLPTPFFAGRLRYALFVDAGTLSNAGGHAPLRITPGFGLRYSSPLGPIRFDVGFNGYSLQPGPLYEINANGTLKLRQSDFQKLQTKNYTLHFSIGQAF
ncbi:MAG: BamA/TamA family outer membrane protein, partial [Gemmatimonadota bacterium]